MCKTNLSLICAIVWYIHTWMCVCKRDKYIKLYRQDVHCYNECYKTEINWIRSFSLLLPFRVRRKFEKLISETEEMGNEGL